MGLAPKTTQLAAGGAGPPGPQPGSLPGKTALVTKPRRCCVACFTGPHGQGKEENTHVFRAPQGLRGGSLSTAHSLSGFFFFVVVGVTFSTMPAQTTMSQASVTLPPARAPRPLSVPVLPLPGPLACPPLSVLGCCLVQSSPCVWAAGTVTLMGTKPLQQMRAAPSCSLHEDTPEALGCSGGSG